MADEAEYGAVVFDAGGIAQNSVENLEAGGSWLGRTGVRVYTGRVGRRGSAEPSKCDSFHQGRVALSCCTVTHTHIYTPQVQTRPPCCRVCVWSFVIALS